MPITLFCNVDYDYKQNLGNTHGRFKRWIMYHLREMSLVRAHIGSFHIIWDSK